MLCENACVYVCYVCARCVGKPGDGAESSRTVVIVSCGFWEPNAGPLQEQQMPQSLHRVVSPRKARIQQTAAFESIRPRKFAT